MRRAVSGAVYNYILVSTPPLRLNCDHCFNHTDQDAMTNTLVSPGKTNTQLMIFMKHVENISQGVSRMYAEKDFLTSSLLPATPESPDNIIHLKPGGWWRTGRWSSHGISAVFCVCVFVCAVLSWKFTPTKSCISGVLFLHRSNWENLAREAHSSLHLPHTYAHRQTTTKKEAKNTQTNTVQIRLKDPL